MVASWKKATMLITRVYNFCIRRRRKARERCHRSMLCNDDFLGHFSYGADVFHFRSRRGAESVAREDDDTYRNRQRFVSL